MEGEKKRTLSAEVSTDKKYWHIRAHVSTCVDNEEDHEFVTRPHQQNKLNFFVAYKWAKVLVSDISVTI